MPISLLGRSAIITGAGTGLGREHALALARYGASVLVNDRDAGPARAVADEIVDGGGEAIPFAADVADMTAVEAMVAEADARWGGPDILLCNAGILRDRSFAKMEIADFRLVLEVHLMGSVHCAKAVWEGMRRRGHGRIILTTSSSGLYGNFGQSNYGAAKMALVGLMQTLGIEGARYGIRVNCLAPSAATGMTEALYADEDLRALRPAMVSPAVVALAADDAPSRRILLAGAGSFEQANITMTRGVYLGGSDDPASDLAARMDAVGDRRGEILPAEGGEQYRYESAHARRQARNDVAVIEADA